MKFKVLQKKDLKGAVQKFSAMKGAAAGSPNVAIVVNADGTLTVMGLHASGAVSDISDVATLTPPPSSDNTAVLTVGTPTGMTLSFHGVSAGNANIVGLTATWNDGSIGPFTADPVPCTVSNVPDPITGLVVTINP